MCGKLQYKMWQVKNSPGVGCLLHKACFTQFVHPEKPKGVYIGAYTKVS